MSDSLPRLTACSTTSVTTRATSASGLSTAPVTGSGAPTANFVYKLVEVDGVAVHKRSTNKASRGGRKQALRMFRDTGTAVEEVVHPAGHPPEAAEPHRVLTVPLVRAGGIVTETVKASGMFLCFGTEDIASAHERAVLHGMNPSDIRQPEPDARYFYVYDPDGLSVQVREYR